MNESIISQPIVVLTGAGASVTLGKATTFTIYDTPEFQEFVSQNPVNHLMNLKNALTKSKRPVDLEALLDRARELNREFDDLNEAPPYEGELQGGAPTIRLQLEEACEKTLDFLVSYYSSVGEDQAVELYDPFFSGLQALQATAGGVKSILPFFTLNYDEAIESAVDGIDRYTLRDGFGDGNRRYWQSSNFDSIQPTRNGSSVVLFKIHGSSSWTKKEASKRVEKTPDLPRRSADDRGHVILYPTRFKDTRGEPFATGYDYLNESLTRASVAVFIGTSFRDAELIEVISAAYESGGPFSILGVGPDVDKREIAATLGLPRNNIHTAKMNFETSSISTLLGRIETCLKSAPARRRQKRK